MRGRGREREENPKGKPATEKNENKLSFLYVSICHSVQWVIWFILSTFILQMQQHLVKSSAISRMVVSVECMDFVVWLFIFFFFIFRFFILSFLLLVQLCYIVCRREKANVVYCYTFLLADADKQITIYWSIGHTQIYIKNLVETISWLQSHHHHHHSHRLSSTDIELVVNHQKELVNCMKGTC